MITMDSRPVGQVQRADRYPSKKILPGMRPPLKQVSLDGDFSA